MLVVRFVSDTPPAGIMLPTSAPKRRRTNTACENCRKKKIRCDSGSPKCGYCSNNSLECVVKKNPRSAGATKKGDLSKRLERIENILTRLTEGDLNLGFNSVGPGRPASLHDDSDDNSDDEDHSEEDNQGGSKASGEDGEEPFSMYPNMLHISNDDDPIYSHGMCGAVFSARTMSFLKSKINNDHLVARLQAEVAQSVVLSREQSLSRLKMADNPPPLDSDMFGLVLGILKKKSVFFRTFVSVEEYEEFSKPHNLMSGGGLQEGHTLLVYSVTALICNMLTIWDPKAVGIELTRSYSPEYLLSQVEIALAHAVKAAQAIPFLRLNFHILKGVVPLMMVLAKSSIPPTMTYYCNMAMSIAVSLGLNRAESYTGYTEEEKLERMQIWWFVYICDRDVAVKFGQPPNISDDEISTPPPPHVPLTSDCGPHLRPVYDLCRVYGVVYDKLFSVKASKRSKEELNRETSACNRILNEWRDNLPPEFKLDDKCDVSSELFGLPEYSILVTKVYMLQISYEQLFCLVHRNSALIPRSVENYLHNASSPQSGVVPTIQEQPSPAQLPRLLQSLNACAESARRELTMVRKLLEYRFGLSPGLLFVAFQAATNLFIKSVVQPDANSQSDARALRVVTELYNARVAVGQNTIANARAFHVWADIIDSCYERRNYSTNPYLEESFERGVSSNDSRSPSNISNGHSPKTPMSSNSLPPLTDKVPVSDLGTPMLDNMATELFPEMAQYQFANDMLFMSNSIFNYSEMI